MTALALCLLFFFATYALAWRSLAQGMMCLLVIGYFNGILRANVLDPAAYFFFDSALLGLYLAQFSRRTELAQVPAYRELLAWVAALMIWPCILLAEPTQSMLVRLVGLRANVLFWPMLLLGARLDDRDLPRLGLCAALLNLLALGFGVAEYFLGVEPFFPRSPVTELIYASNDVANYKFYRIPAIFGHAHIYGGTMALSLCFLIPAWLNGRPSGRAAALLMAGIAAAFMGIFLCAARMPLILAGVAFAATTVFIPKSRSLQWLLLPALIGAVYLGVQGNDRLTRFQLLSDTHATEARLSQSANDKFYDVLAEYPLGNGLGGGGTSVPFFLAQGMVKPRVMSENEYARIVLEQGWIGLGIFASFLCWVLTRPLYRSDPWFAGRAVFKLFLMVTFATAFIGTGLLAAVPYSAMLLFGLGWVLMSPAPARRGDLPRHAVYGGHDPSAGPA